MYNGTHDEINTSATDSLVSWKARQTPIQRNQSEDSAVKAIWLKEPVDQGIGDDISLFRSENQDSSNFSAYVPF
ncbi:MAG: hypothetical protein IJ510_03435 [Selenomonadales bacterium]|nr:hypothetical protein [Selenomonadales bacterium]